MVHTLKLKKLSKKHKKHKKHTQHGQLTKKQYFKQKGDECMAQD